MKEIVIVEEVRKINKLHILQQKKMRCINGKTIKSFQLIKNENSYERTKVKWKILLKGFCARKKNGKRSFDLESANNVHRELKGCARKGSDYIPKQQNVEASPSWCEISE